MLGWMMAPLMCAAAVPQAKLAVVDIETRGVDKDTGALLTEVLTVEIADLHRFAVVSSSDIQTMLGFERQRELLACSEALCIAEIGGALGVDKLVVGQVGRIGETFLLNLKVIDVRSVQTEARLSETVNGKIDDLVAVVKTSVGKLFAPGAAAQAKPPSSSAAPNAPVAAGPVPSAAGHSSARPSRGVGLGPLALWLGGGVALGSGGFFGWRARQSYVQTRDADMAGRQTALAKGRGAQTVANVSFGVGGAALLGGVAWWLLTRGAAPAVTVFVAPATVGFALELAP